MWIEKLSSGVLRVLTPLGPRYLKPSTLVQRLYLLWIFRNFSTLPAKVLTPRQTRLIESMCDEQRFVALSQNNWEDAPILGTLEQRPLVEPSHLPPRRPSGRVTEVTPFAADFNQRS